MHLLSFNVMLMVVFENFLGKQLYGFLDTMVTQAYKYKSSVFHHQISPEKKMEGKG